MMTKLLLRKTKSAEKMVMVMVKWYRKSIQSNNSFLRSSSYKNVFSHEAVSLQGTWVQQQVVTGHYPCIRTAVKTCSSLTSGSIGHSCDVTEV
ncbi:Hypothetical predicted protein [Scomber scombrus]|uniref:Uncharacterized protein n=1 Tax=Scomber scombrus TaxID=13677 RepID=A0AAV1PNF2_SCOSC